MEKSVKKASFTAQRSSRAKKPRRKSNGWSAKWSDRVGVKEGQSAWVLLTPGNYLTAEQQPADWYECTRFNVKYMKTMKDGSKRQVFESCTPNEGECTLTTQAMAGHSAISGIPRNDEPNRFFMNCIEFGVNQKEVVTDRDGNPLRYQHGKMKGEEIFRWNKITSIRERKAAIQNEDPENVSFWRKKFFDLPPTHFNVLREIARKAKKMCLCGGTLQPVHYVCSHCGETLLDIDHTDLSESEVSRFGDQEIRCDGCGAYDLPLAETECDSCDTPRPHKFHEVVAEIQKTIGDKGFPQLVLSRVESLSDFKTADGQFVVVRDENNQPLIDDEDPDFRFVVDEKLEKLMKSQFDFELYTEPQANSYYSEILGLREGQLGYVSDSKPYTSFR